MTGIYDVTSALSKAKFPPSLISNKAVINLIDFPTKSFDEISPPPSDRKHKLPEAKKSKLTVPSSSPAMSSRKKPSRKNASPKKSPPKTSSFWNYLKPSSSVNPAKESYSSAESETEGQSGKGKPRPPGKRPRILYLYR